jgi:hypothetical protein
MNNHFYEEIIKILTPFLGKSMTETSVKLQCKKLGISEDRISSSHLNDLILKLSPGLRTFLGSEKANQVADSIRSIK